MYSGKAWQRLRLTVLVRDRYTCHWCGGPANEADHVQAVAEGGAFWSLGNLVAACPRCNKRRGGQVRDRQRVADGDRWRPPSRGQRMVWWGAIPDTHSTAE